MVFSDKCDIYESDADCAREGQEDLDILNAEPSKT